MIANHLWQSTAFAMIAALLALALRGNRACTRHCVWLAASLKFLVPFAMLAALGSEAGSRTAVRAIATAPVVLRLEALAEPVQSGLPAPVPGRTIPWTDVGFVVWACGTVVVAARWWNRWRKVRLVVGAARALEIDFPVPVRTSAAAIEPGIFGIVRPVLLLPEGIAERLTPAQRRAILAHELCHVRRRDNLWAAAHMLVEALFWFHPAVWWIGARLVEERERACDEEVVASGGEPEAYAEGILAACRLYLESPLACVAGVGGGEMRKRVERIMGEWEPRELSAAGKALIGSSAALAVAMPVLVGFLHAPPVRAQAEERPKFEVASIKPAPTRPILIVRALQGGRLSADATVRLLIQNAYSLQAFQIADAPGWTGSDHYRIEAKSEHDAPRAEVMLSLQTLLEDRFRLRYHRETRDLPIYELSAARSGPKLSASKEGECENSADPLAEPTGGRMAPPGRGPVPPAPCGSVGVALETGGARMFGRKVAMAEFVRVLSMVLDRPVVDRTGVTETFGVRLDFLPDAATPVLPPPPPDAASSDTMGPPIFTALQEQLGLKLESVKGPVEVMVIDHLERPSEN
jgi:bla regulator protein blaR1